MLHDLEAFLRYVTLIAVRFYLLTYLRAIRSSNASSGSASAGHNIAVINKDRRYCSLCLQHEQGLFSVIHMAVLNM